MSEATELNHLSLRRLAGLKPPRQALLKDLEAELDACCERNFGCDGCPELNDCLQRWWSVIS